MRVTIFDYGSGNLHSLVKALEGEGRTLQIETDPARALATDALVFPGVGAFGHAAQRLAPARPALRAAIAAGLPCLGICLGLQLLFDASDEGEGAGLGVFAGRVTRLAARRVPHMGWNAIAPAGEPLLGAAPLEMAYFANSYACRPEVEGEVTAWCVHETERFPAIVRRGSAWGCQFHPEKSSAAGVRLLRAWLEECAACA